MRTLLLLLSMSLFCFLPRPAFACGGTRAPERFASGHHGGRDPAPDPQAAALHGGQVLRAVDLRFEVVLVAGEVRVYAYDDAGAPVDLRATEGEVRLGSREAPVIAGFELVRDRASGEDFLAATLPDRTAPSDRVRVQVSLRGLPSEEEPEVDLVVALRDARAQPAPAPAGHRH